MKSLAHNVPLYGVGVEWPPRTEAPRGLAVAPLAVAPLSPGPPSLPLLPSRHVGEDTEHRVANLVRLEQIS